LGRYAKLPDQRSGDDFLPGQCCSEPAWFLFGIERIFERLAENLDGSLPKGENWHQALLFK